MPSWASSHKRVCCFLKAPVRRGFLVGGLRGNMVEGAGFAGKGGERGVCGEGARACSISLSAATKQPHAEINQPRLYREPSRACFINPFAPLSRGNPVIARSEERSYRAFNPFARVSRGSPVIARSGARSCRDQACSPRRSNKQRSTTSPLRGAGSCIRPSRLLPRRSKLKRRATFVVASSEHDLTSSTVSRY
jgi:hypothetical protein